MRTKSLHAALAACLSAVLLAACGGSGAALDRSAQNDAGMQASTASDSGLDPDRAAELEALFNERQAEAKTRFTQADVDFMTGMIAHHAQALVMSALAPTNGASPSIQTLCARIINAQNDEIATMQGWLRDRELPVPEIHIDGLHLMVHGVGDHHMHMPGMLSQDQLDELAGAKDSEFDRLFLTYMIQHHQGAITMVDEWFSTDGVGADEAAFKLAADINVDQATEIARMQLMLDRMTSGDE